MHTGFINFHQFLTMGGYGVYVWPSYALVLFVMVGNVIATRCHRRKLLKKADVQFEPSA